MKRAVTLPWNAAAWRHRNPQPEYHHVAPIGDASMNKLWQHDCCCADCVSVSKRACTACGYHVCSCERQPALRDVPVREGYVLLEFAYLKPGQVKHVEYQVAMTPSLTSSVSVQKFEYRNARDFPVGHEPCKRVGVDE